MMDSQTDTEVSEVHYIIMIKQYTVNLYTLCCFPALNSVKYFNFHSGIGHYTRKPKGAH